MFDFREIVGPAMLIDADCTVLWVDKSLNNLQTRLGWSDCTHVGDNLGEICKYSPVEGGISKCQRCSAMLKSLMETGEADIGDQTCTFDSGEGLMKVKFSSVMVDNLRLTSVRFNPDM